MSALTSVPIQNNSRHGSNPSQIVTRAVGQTGLPSQLLGPPSINQTGNITATTSSASDMGTSTYSLFNSPWPSGLTVSRATKDGTRTTGASNMDPLLMQPRIQSLWSGPGPSPLERLLEQQKQRRDGTNQ